MRLTSDQTGNAGGLTDDPGRSLNGKDRKVLERMIFFHLSDLHIGLKLVNRSMKEDQEFILDQIVRKAQQVKPDAVVIAGDIYDKSAPSAESVELFDHFLSDLNQVVPNASILVISGNHDSPQRIDLYRSILCEKKIHMIGNPPGMPEDHIEKVTLYDSVGPVHFYLLPFVRPSMVRQVIGTKEDGMLFSYNDTIHQLIGRETIDENERNVLVSHQFYLPVGQDADGIERMDSEIKTVGNIDEVRADVLEPFDYAALGHIHKPMIVGKEIYRYSGTPLACSVSEAGQQKGIVQVELGAKGSVSTTVLPLNPLRRVRVIRGRLHEVLLQACEDYITVILTDSDDLDVIDMQDRLRAAFPYLLEIRREVRSYDVERIPFKEEKEISAFELCISFLNEPDEAECELLRDVINTVQEERI